MGRIGVLDGAVIVVYFAGVTIFGALLGRRTRSTRDFFLAGQRFPAWLVAFSCVATTVGSYSFLKYSAAGYQYGVASSQTYLNDWFWMPLFLFGWLPIVYRSGVLSVPEYFRRRFDGRVGLAATAVLLLYLVGYIGINLFTMGTALQELFGFDLFTMAALVVALCMVYEMTGGQTSVILTDFVQGGLLLVAGLLVAALGVARLGGLSAFAAALPAGHLRPLPPFDHPAKFSFVGVFWQDAMAGGVAFYFMNQGMLMRFLSARSLRTGRAAAGLVLVVLMPLSAVAVSGAGWVGSALVRLGVMDAGVRPDDVFVTVATLLCGPGLLGLVMAALLAALMSTADTLINATSALLVNDVYRPWVAPGRDDAHYLRAARYTSLGAAAAGLALVPLYGSFGTIYEAHGAFTAAVTPPMAAAILLAFLWPRFNSAGALATLLGGTVLVLASIADPALVAPFSHRVAPAGYGFLRACFGLAVSGALGVGATLATRGRPLPDARAFTIRGLREHPRRPRAGSARRRPATLWLRDDIGPDLVLVPPAAMERLDLAPGDSVFVDDRRFWLGGLRSVRGRVAPWPDAPAADALGLAPAPAEEQRWREGRRVVLERLDR